MRATYYKEFNTIGIELTEGEFEEYGSMVSSDAEFTVRRTDNNLWEVAFPCSIGFFNKSQRVKGGEQPWNQEQLRNGVRAAVANKLVPYPGIGAEEWNMYRQCWTGVYQQLLRNVRLLFPRRRGRRAR